MPERTARPWPALMSPETAAAYLDLSVRTIEKLRATGQLPAAVKLPGDLRCVRFRREDLDAAVALWAGEAAPLRRAG